MTQAGRNGRSGIRCQILLSIVSAAVSCFSCAPISHTHHSATPESVPALPGIDWTRTELLGIATLPAGHLFAGTVVGGLSALAYMPEKQVYYALSDDPARHGPARYYRLRIDLNETGLVLEDVQILDQTALLTEDGKSFATDRIDPEGLAPLTNGDLFVVSEGWADHGVAPSIVRYAPDGTQVAAIPIPDYYLPRPEAGSGVRHNLGFESASISPDGHTLFVATESALRQDGDPSDVGRSSRARILEYDIDTGDLLGEYFYPIDPVHASPRRVDGFRVAGLVELLSLGSGRLWALERSFGVGVGFRITLYETFLPERTAITDRSPNSSPVTPPPLNKKLLLDLGDLGFEPRNIEGMTLGPILSDGRRTLLLVTDDNFSPDGAGSRFIALTFAAP